MRSDREHLVFEVLDLAPASDVAYDEHAAAERAKRVTQRRPRKAENASAGSLQIDLGIGDHFAALQGFHHRREGFRHLLGSQRPVPPVLAVERLPEDDARVVQTQQLAGGVIEPDDSAGRIDDKQRIRHAGEDRL